MNAERDFNEVALYYGLPSVRHRTAPYRIGLALQPLAHPVHTLRRPSKQPGCVIGAPWAALFPITPAPSSDPHFIPASYLST